MAKTYADHMRDLLVADGNLYRVEYGDAGLLDDCYYLRHPGELAGECRHNFDTRWPLVLAGLRRSEMFESGHVRRDRFTGRGPVKSFHTVFELKEEFR